MTINDYMAQLERELRRAARAASAPTHETEDHLRDLCVEPVAAGLVHEQADRAVTQLGAASTPASRKRRRQRPPIALSA